MSASRPSFPFKFRAKTQMYCLVLFILNLWCAICPAWTLRRLFLAAVGCRLGAIAIIHRRVKLFCPGRLSVGLGSVINEGCDLDNRRGIDIGSHVSIARDVKSTRLVTISTHRTLRRKVLQSVLVITL